MKFRLDKILLIFFILILLAIPAMWLAAQSDAFKNAVAGKISRELKTAGLDASMEFDKFRFPGKVRLKNLDLMVDGIPAVSLSQCDIGGAGLYLLTGKKRFRLYCEYGEADLEKAGRLFNRKSGEKSEKRPDDIQLKGRIELFHGRYKSKDFKAYIEFEHVPGSRFIQVDGEKFGSIRAGKNGETDVTDISFEKVPVDEIVKEMIPRLEGTIKGFAEGRILITDTGNSLSLKIPNIGITRLSITNDFLEKDVFRIDRININGLMEICPSSKSITIRAMSFESKGVAAEMTGMINRNVFEAILSASGINPTDAAELIGGSEISDFNLDGEIDLFVDVSGRTGEDFSLDKFRIAGSINGLRQKSGRLDYLKNAFSYRFEKPDGETVEVIVGPSNPGFVYFNSIPRHVYGAVLASEDAGFFGHSGIDFKEMENALNENIGGRQVWRGGSTITQQLAKNLFLSREKTLLRKFREMLIAIELEATISKNRILEIYLNGIEWGPGIFGIGSAARHYFGKSVESLTPAEAVYLAMIIPNPCRYYVFFRKNQMPEDWNKRMREMLERMQHFGYISESQLKASLGEKIVFSGRDEPVGTCNIKKTDETVP